MKKIHRGDGWDGSYLYAYHTDSSDGSLHFLQRKPPYGYIRLIDDDWTIHLGAEKKPDQTGYVIATSPLTDEEWKPFKPGELIVFKMVFSSNGRM